MKPHLLILIPSLVVTACAVDIPKSSRQKDLVPPSQSAVGLRDARPATLLKVGSKQAASMSQPVSLNMSNVQLLTVLNAAVPDMEVVPMDGGVNLRQQVSVQIKSGTLEELLQALTVDANLSFDVQGANIEVSSSMTREWNLAAFSAQRRSYGSVGGAQGGAGSQTGANNQGGQGGQGGQGAQGGGAPSTAGAAGGSSVSVGGNSGAGIGTAGGSGVETSIAMNEDEWAAMINTARSMLGLDSVEDADGGTTGGGSGGQPANSGLAASSDGGRNSLVAIRSLGLVRATGSPRRVARLDRWMTRLADQSTKQVHLDVKTMEVALNDNRARGINWQALVGGSINGLDLSGLVGFSGPISPSNFPSTAGGLTAQGQGVDGGSPEFEAVLQFLSQYGEVSLVNEPNVTVTNGRTANLTTGDEIPYLASVTQTIVEGGTTVTTPSIARVLVGVKLAVTPRLLDDNRVLVNVVPVITNLQGFEQFSVGGNEFTNPNIALQSLATQVITRPGVPIHIGGLISSRLRSTLNSLPVKQRFLDNPLKWLFSSEQNSLERRELVIMITPSVVET